jgi:CheY-like chemotaxis protein
MSRGPILVVDDDPVIRRTVAEILSMEEYAVSTAPDGAQALLEVERERPGLVLLDMRMPVLDGWGFARALRERNIALPIVVMTAARDSARWAAEIGAAGHLAKPFDLSDLLAAVERVYGAA